LGKGPYRYAAAVFDLDGVLVDSEPLHLKSVALMLARRGIQLKAAQAAQQTGITIHRFMDKIVHEWGYPGPKEGEDWVAEKRAIFRELAPQELRPLPGVDDFLRAIDGRLRIGLASSSPRGYIEWCIRQFGWDDRFDAVCTIEDVRRAKPDPEMYLLSVEQLGVAADRTLAFEDSPVGIESAVVAGLDCVGVESSFAAGSLRALGAKWTIKDFTDSVSLSTILGGAFSAGR
jgi:beta-phosphoglucomutase